MINDILQFLGLDHFNIKLSAKFYQNIPNGLLVGWLCWGLTSQSTIFQSCRDGAIASWVINQYFRGVKCLAQGHNTAAVGLEPRTSRSGVRHSTTEPPRSPPNGLRIKFHFFQKNLNLGKTSTNPKCHLTISMATSCQYQCVCKISSQCSTQFKRWCHFHFFRIWSSAKLRLSKNDFSQSLGLGLVNINVYAEVYQNIPLSSRDKAIFTYSKFGARQSLDRWCVILQ